MAMATGSRQRSGKKLARGGTAIVAHQRNARVAQGLDARGNGQRSRDVPGFHALARNSEFFDDIESATAAGQANDLVHRLDGIQAGLAHLALDQTDHILFHHTSAEDVGYRIDEGVAPQNAVHVAVVEDVLLLPGQAQGRA